MNIVGKAAVIWEPRLPGDWVAGEVAFRAGGKGGFAVQTYLADWGLVNCRLLAGLPASPKGLWEANPKCITHRGSRGWEAGE